MATATAPVHHAHAPAHTPRSRWTGPGWWRALLGTVVGFVVAFGLVSLARLALKYHPTIDWTAIATVAMISMPMGFVIGIGCFDYWFYWAAGKPTREEDHSGHGATKWQDYFRVNTDHKVIGIQYIVT